MLKSFSFLEFLIYNAQKFGSIRPVCLIKELCHPIPINTFTESFIIFSLMWVSNCKCQPCSFDPIFWTGSTQITSFQVQLKYGTSSFQLYDFELSQYKVDKYLFTQPLHHREDLMQSHFLSRVQLVCIQRFPSPGLVAYSRRKKSFCPTIFPELGSGETDGFRSFSRISVQNDM